MKQTFAEQFAEYMDFAKKPGTGTADLEAGKAISDWFQENHDAELYYCLKYPMEAMERGYSPFLGLWATAFMMGVEFERRARELAERMNKRSGGR